MNSILYNLNIKGVKKRERKVKLHVERIWLDSYLLPDDAVLNKAKELLEGYTKVELATITEHQANIEDGILSVTLIPTRTKRIVWDC